MTKPIIHIANPGDYDFYDKAYLVHLHELDTMGILTFANSVDSALDEAADYAERQYWNGVFAPFDEIGLDEEDEYLYCGSRSLAIRRECVRVIPINTLAKREAAHLIGFMANKGLKLMYDQACSILWPMYGFHVEDDKSKAIKAMAEDDKIFEWFGYR